MSFSQVRLRYFALVLHHPCHLHRLAEPRALLTTATQFTVMLTDHPIHWFFMYRDAFCCVFVSK